MRITRTSLRPLRHPVQTSPDPELEAAP